MSNLGLGQYLRSDPPGTSNDTHRLWQQGDCNSLITASVDMMAYLQWLQENYQWSLAAP